MIVNHVTVFSVFGVKLNCVTHSVKFEYLYLRKLSIIGNKVVWDKHYYSNRFTVRNIFLLCYSRFRLICIFNQSSSNASMGYSAKYDISQITCTYRMILAACIYNCKYYLSKDTITNTKINVCHKYFLTRVSNKHLTQSGEYCIYEGCSEIIETVSVFS